MSNALHQIDVGACMEGVIPLRRHDLVYLSARGRRAVYQNIPLQYKTGANANYIQQLLVDGLGPVPVPGIVRRPQHPLVFNDVALGYTSPKKFKGKRLQIPTFVSQDAIIALETPYDVIRRPYKERNICLATLSKSVLAADNLGISVGVWGSVALELSTGLPYVMDSSDLDLTTNSTDINSLRDFLTSLQQIERKFSVRIDVELALPTDTEVQLKELFSGVNNVLSKSISEVKFLSKNEVFEILNDHQKGQSNGN